MADILNFRRIFRLLDGDARVRGFSGPEFGGERWRKR